MFWWPQKEFVNSILEFNSTTWTLCESLRCHPTPSKAFTAGKKVKHPLPAQCQHLLEGTPPPNHQNLKAPLHGCKKTQASNFAAACFSKRRFLILRLHRCRMPVVAMDVYQPFAEHAGQHIQNFWDLTLRRLAFLSRWSVQISWASFSSFAVLNSE